MDKKKALFAAFVLAVSAVTAGCDKKDKQPKEEDTPVTADSFGNYAENDTGEKEFIELSDSDFKTIFVPVNIMEEEAPVTVKRIDLSGIEIEEKVPVCYKAENVEKYVSEHNTYQRFNENGYIISSSYGVDDGGIPQYDWHDYIDKPVKGQIEGGYVRGKDCYIYVEYDVLMGGNCYNNSILKYDTESGKTEEIYSWSSEDISETSVNSYIFGDDSAFLIYFKKTGDEESNSRLWTIKRVDLDTKEVITAFEETRPMSYVYLTNDNVGNVFYNWVAYDDDSNEERREIYKFDKENGNFKIIDEHESSDEINKNESTDEIKSSAFFNDKFYSLVKPEGKRKLDIVCDSYRIGTRITNAKIVYADNECFLLKNDDQLNVYNINKMEHYVLNVKGLGEQFLMSDGKLFIASGDTGFKQPLYCLIPELGLAYKVGENNVYANMTCINGGIQINGKHREDITSINSDGTQVFTHSYDVTDSIYLIYDKD